MQVEQIYQILNTVIGETTGKTDIVLEDLSNVVQVGTEVFDTNQVDNYVKKLIDHIGKVVFVNRGYEGSAPSILMEDWEYGSVMQKIDADIPDAVENPAWQLQDGQHYEQDIFHAPKGVTVKFFNGDVTFQIDFSISQETVKESFDNLTQLNAFFSMLETKINTRLTIDLDNLIMRTINNFIGLTMANEYPSANYGASSGVRAINLLALYNAENADNPLTVATAMKSLDFIKFASYFISITSDRLVKANRVFNIGGRLRHTPKNLQHIVMLSEFMKRADVYLQSDTFHNELTKLPKAETVVFWQGSGTKFDFGSTSAIHINANNGTSGVEVQISGILAVIFDRDALAVNRHRRRVTSHYNANGDFVNYFYKEQGRYYNDTNENFVVFFIADSPAVAQLKAVK